MRHRVRPVVLLCAVAGTVALAACGAKTSNNTSSSSGSSTAAQGGKQGGSMTVVLNSGYDGAWPAGLDPVTNTNGAANQSLMNSIYGQLIELHEGGKLVPGLASAFNFSNGGKTFTLTIRPGVKFSDGTPFTAQVVADHINKVLKSSCTCRPTWPVKSVKASGSDVVINFATVYAPAAASFIDSNANWVPSPTAVKKLGEREFRVMPVGAGPFTVVSDKLSSQIVLKKNPTYFKKGRPFLDQLTFKSIGGDEAAYQALQAGQAQAYENLSTPSLIDQMKKDPKLQVTQQLSTSPYNIQLNTNAPPFNNPKARQAIYYATNSEAIRDKLFQNRYPSTQGFTAPGGLFFSADVPGYRTYDLEKAKALVKELGGLKTQLGTINVLVAKQTTQALASQWAQAGIKTDIKSYDLGPLIQAFQSKKWTAMLQTAGSYDPAAGVGVAFRYASQSPFSGVKDKKLDALLGQASGTLDQGQRKSLYDQAAKYMNDEAYSPFLFAFAPASVAAKGVTGPGLTTALTCVVVTPSILYDEVSMGGGGGA